MTIHDSAGQPYDADLVPGPEHRDTLRALAHFKESHEAANAAALDWCRLLGFSPDDWNYWRDFTPRIAELAKQVPLLTAEIERWRDATQRLRAEMEHQAEIAQGRYVEIEQLRAGIEEALMHLNTNYDIDGRSMRDSDAANALHRALEPNPRRP